jgi:hypothetical protein
MPHGLLAVVQFKENVTNVTDLAIGRMHVLTREGEPAINPAVIEGRPTQGGGENRGVVVVQVVVGEENEGEGDRARRGVLLPLMIGINVVLSIFYIVLLL